jgi:hypothetical protein
MPRSKPVAMTAAVLPEMPNVLPDVDPIYLLDRSSWADFKRALNECSLIWNLPDWMTTIVHHGVEWKHIADGGNDLSVHFPDAPAVEEKVVPGAVPAGKMALGAKLVLLLDLPQNSGDSMTPGLRFCNLSTVQFEHEKKLPARQKLWNWMVRCLRGNGRNVGPYHYIVQEVQMFDISYLFTRLRRILEQITICSLDDELEAVIKCDFKPQQQNIFSYLTDLRKAMKRLQDVNDRLPESGRIIFPDAFVRSRLVRAARQLAVYKPVIDALVIKPAEECTKITSDDYSISLRPYVPTPLRSRQMRGL